METIFAYVFCALTLPLLVMTAYFDAKGNKPIKTALKSLASACFVVAGALCFAQSNAQTWQILVLVGLVLGFAGDILLSEFAKNAKVKSLYDAVGMLFFIGGHALYISAFFIAAGAFEPYCLIAISLALALVTLALALKAIVPPNATYAVGVVIYTGIVATMLAAALNLVMVTNATYSIYIAVGASAFFVSDIMLGLVNFNQKVKDKRKYLFPTLLVFYYLGQSLIALSLLN